MGYFPVGCKYVLLPLVNKESDLVNSQAEYSQMGKETKINGERKWSWGRCQLSPKNQDMR